MKIDPARIDLAVLYPSKSLRTSFQYQIPTPFPIPRLPSPSNSPRHGPSSSPGICAPRHGGLCGKIKLGRSLRVSLVNPLTPTSFMRVSPLLHASSQVTSDVTSPPKLMTNVSFAFHSQANTHLNQDNYELVTDCNSLTYCADNGTCAWKGCRKDTVSLHV